MFRYLRVKTSNNSKVLCYSTQPASHAALNVVHISTAPSRKEDFMTRNQIAFYTAKEQQRTNKAQEAETKRHNVTSEGIASGQLTESARHNKATEAVNWYTAQNLAGLQAAQAASAYAAAEKSSSEVGVQALLASEQQRHDVATEQEATRHNQATEEYTAERYQRQSEIEESRTSAQNFSNVSKGVRDIVASAAGVFALIK